MKYVQPLLLFLALLVQPAPPPVHLVLLAPENVQPGQEFLISAVIWGDASTYDILLGLGAPPAFTTDDDLIRSARVETDRPTIVQWWVRAGDTPGRGTLMVHTADTPASVRTVWIGRRVWLPLVSSSGTRDNAPALRRQKHP